MKQEEGTLFWQIEKANSELCALGRLAASANGTLQQIVSAWANAPVHVRVLQNDLIPSPSSTGRYTPSSAEKLCYERKIQLECDGFQSHFCEAKSVVELNDKRLIEAIQSGRVGIGQLFRQFNLKPEFKLIHLASKGEYSLERRYLLYAGNGIVCDIHEAIDLAHILSGLTEEQGIKKRNVEEVLMQVREEQELAAFSALDIRGTDTILTIDRAFARRVEPFERVIMFTNPFNLPRVLTSYRNEHVHARYAKPRQVSWNCFALTSILYVNIGDLEQVVCRIDREVEIKCPQLLDRVTRGELEIERDGSIFEDVLPTFSLVSCRKILENGSAAQIHSPSSDVTETVSDHNSESCADEQPLLVREYLLSSQTVSERVRDSFFRL